MSLEFAILGILNVVPMTGYDLKHQAFDQSVAHFWPADQSQIYRTLSRLADKGWASMSVEEQDDRPDRKVYSITEGGRSALHEWLTNAQDPPILRDPFLVQLFFGMELTKEELLALIDAQVEAHRERIGRYEEIPIPPREARPNDRWLALQHLTLAFGFDLERAYLTWLQHCRSVIEELPPPEDPEVFRARFRQLPPQDSSSSK